MKLNREHIEKAFAIEELWSKRSPGRSRVGLSGGCWTLGGWIPLAIVGGFGVIWTIQLRPDLLPGQEMFIAIVVWVAVVTTTDGITADVAYFEVVSQVIPVLFLAFVADRRLRVSRREEIQSRVIVLSAYAMVVAEYHALSAVADNASGNNLSLVTAGLAVAAIAVVLPALVEDRTPSSDK